ncbi:fibronectin-like [Branchiostoma floridae x Branchiostoma japonicum]
MSTQPNAPTGFIGTSTSPTTIGLSWTVPSTANGATFAKYRIIYTPDGGTSYVEEIFDPTATSTTLTGLSPGVQYTISLVAVGAVPNPTESAEAAGGPLTLRTNPNAPENFAVTSFTTTTFGLSWMEPDSANGATFAKYTITYAPTGHAPQTVDVDKTATGTTLTGLSPGVQYTISLVAVSADDSIVSAEASGGPLTVRTKPNAPTGFTGTSITTSTIGLNWAVPSAANGATFDKYWITYTTGGTSYSLEVTDATATSTTLTGLSPGVQYTISLVAVSADPNTTESAEATGGPLTVRTKPNAPIDFAGTSITTTTIGLNWTVPSAANGVTFDKFRITYTPDGGSSQVKEITDISATSTTLTGLSSGALYTISLVAVSAEPNPTESAEAPGGPLTVRTIVLAVAQPGDITIASSDVTENSIRITWTAAAGAVDSYSISISPADGDNPSGSVNASSSLEYTFTGLTAGTEYIIIAIAVSDGVNSVARTITQRTTVAQPGAISIAPSDVSENSIRVTWVAPAGAKDSYIIIISPDSDVTNPTGSVNDGDTLEYTFTGLTAGTLYTINVITVSGGVNSAAKTKQQRTTVAQPGVVNIAPSDVTDNSIRITWTAAAGAKDSYSIDISPTGSVNDGDRLEYSFDSLTAGTLYIISVTTVSGGVTSVPIRKEQRTNLATGSTTFSSTATGSLNPTTSPPEGNPGVSSAVCSASGEPGVYAGVGIGAAVVGVVIGVLTTILVQHMRAKRASEEEAVTYEDVVTRKAPTRQPTSAYGEYDIPMETVPPRPESESPYQELKPAVYEHLRKK